jgi:hypothetical protein
VTYLTRRGRNVTEWGFLLTLDFERTIEKTQKPLNYDKVQVFLLLLGWGGEGRGKGVEVSVISFKLGV